MVWQRYHDNTEHNNVFALFFPEEIQKLPEKARNKNTVKTANTWMNV